MPQHLGFHRFTDDEWDRNHGRNKARILFNIPQGRKCVIVDATYVYMGKSKDHETQRASYCLFKNKNLYKVKNIFMFIYKII